MINKYTWKLYLDAGGREVADTFYVNIESGISEDYISFVYGLQKEYCASSRMLENTQIQLKDLYATIKGSSLGEIDDSLQIISDKEIEEIFSDIYTNDFSQNNSYSDKEAFSIFTQGLVYTSTLLAIEYPGVFLPYYYFANYNVLTMIDEMFDLGLPNLPKKADYKGRTWHYLRLCITFRHFAEENELSPYEFLAFLYDFAPKYIGGKDSYILEDLPEPRSAFFIGGGAIMMMQQQRMILTGSHFGNVIPILMPGI